MKTIYRFRSLRATLLVALGGSILPCAPTFAVENPSIAVVPPAFEGDLPDAAKALLSERLAEGLRAAGLTVRDATDVYDKTCTKPACFREFAKKTGADFLVTVNIKFEQKNYDYSFEILNGFTGQATGALDRRCNICGLTEAGDRMSLAASSLAERLHNVVNEPSRILIHSNAIGAKVSIDGKHRGTVPLEVNLAAGPHKVVLAAPGFLGAERDVTVVAGVDHALDLTLMKVPSDFPYKTAGWVGVGTGAALLATGAYLITLHGADKNCPAADRDQDGDCPKIYQTDFWGAGAFAAGAISATLGGFWLYLGQNTADETPTTGGVSVGIAGYRGSM